MLFQNAVQILFQNTAVHCYKRGDWSKFCVILRPLIKSFVRRPISQSKNHSGGRRGNWRGERYSSRVKLGEREGSRVKLEEGRVPGSNWGRWVFKDDPFGGSCCHWICLSLTFLKEIDTDNIDKRILKNIVRFPNPLDIGSGLGERTPKKVGFQLWRSFSQPKKFLCMQNGV